MGFFDKLMGKDQTYPALDQSSAAYQRIQKHRAMVEPFFQRVNEKFEMIPTDDAVYVFVGKPPSAFGVAWFNGGKEHNLKSFMQEHGLSAQKVQILSDKLRDVYVSFQSAERFSISLGGKTITVTPIDAFGQAVAKVIQEASSAAAA
jgi:hypothetical protein